jgi:hypothetical protein
MIIHFIAPDGETFMTEYQYAEYSASLSSNIDDAIFQETRQHHINLTDLSIASASYQFLRLKYPHDHT